VGSTGRQGGRKGGCWKNRRLGSLGLRQGMSYPARRRTRSEGNPTFVAGSKRTLITHPALLPLFRPPRLLIRNLLLLSPSSPRYPLRCCSRSSLMSPTSPRFRLSRERIRPCASSLLLCSLLFRDMTIDKARDLETFDRPVSGLSSCVAGLGLGSQLTAVVARSQSIRSRQRLCYVRFVQRRASTRPRPSPLAIHNSPTAQKAYPVLFFPSLETVTIRLRYVLGYSPSCIEDFDYFHHSLDLLFSLRPSHVILCSDLQSITSWSPTSSVQVPTCEWLDILTSWTDLATITYRSAPRSYFVTHERQADVGAD
jgi:hypothetical protein